MNTPDTAPADPHAGADDAGRWREAARLRREHPKWVVVWLARIGCYRAYRRLPGARRDTALTARTPDELATQISHAEQPARTPGRPRSDRD
jgi:hypothetical protein